MPVPKLLALDAIVAKLRKSSEAVRKKIDRLGLEVVNLRGLRTTTSLKIPKDLRVARMCFPRFAFPTAARSDRAFKRCFSYPKHAITMTKKEFLFSKIHS